MANITEVSQWENVIRQLENGEAATGGADGLANVQAKQLANRTKWLKDNLAPIVNAAFSGTLKHGNNDLAGSAIVAKSLSANGYIKYASGLIIQWGTVSFADATDKKIVSPVYYPIEFPNDVLSMCAMSTSGDINQDFTSYITGKTKLNFGVGIRGTFVSGKNVSISWLAIGY